MKRALPVVQSRSAAEAQSIASEDIVGEAESVLGAALRRCVSAAPLSLPRSFSLPDIHTPRTRTSTRIHAHARTHSLCYSLSLSLYVSQPPCGLSSNTQRAARRGAEKLPKPNRKYVRK